jgi:hypothetical protein
MPLANGNFLVSIAFFGWIPVIFFLFRLLPHRRAVSTSLLVGWLFLPVATYDLPGFFDVSECVLGSGILGQGQTAVELPSDEI